MRWWNAPYPNPPPPVSMLLRVAQVSARVRPAPTLIQGGGGKAEAMGTHPCMSDELSVRFGLIRVPPFMSYLILCLKSAILGAKLVVKFRNGQRFSGRKVLLTPTIGVGGPTGTIWAKIFFDPGHPSGGPLGGPDTAAPSSTMGDTTGDTTGDTSDNERHTSDTRATHERHTSDTRLSRASWTLKLRENDFQTKLRLRIFLKKNHKFFFLTTP